MTPILFIEWCLAGMVGAIALAVMVSTLCWLAGLLNDTMRGKP